MLKRCLATGAGMEGTACLPKKAKPPNLGRAQGSEQGLGAVGGGLEILLKGLL